MRRPQGAAVGEIGFVPWLDRLAGRATAAHRLFASVPAGLAGQQGTQRAPAGRSGRQGRRAAGPGTQEPGPMGLRPITATYAVPRCRPRRIVPRRQAWHKSPCRPPLLASGVSPG